MAYSRHMSVHDVELNSNSATVLEDRQY